MTCVLKKSDWCIHWKHQSLFLNTIQFKYIQHLTFKFYKLSSSEMKVIFLWPQQIDLCPEEKWSASSVCQWNFSSRPFCWELSSVTNPSKLWNKDFCQKSQISLLLLSVCQCNFPKITRKIAHWKLKEKKTVKRCFSVLESPFHSGPTFSWEMNLSKCFSSDKNVSSILISSFLPNWELETSIESLADRIQKIPNSFNVGDFHF